VRCMLEDCHALDNEVRAISVACHLHAVSWKLEGNMNVGNMNVGNMNLVICNRQARFPR